MVTITLNSGLVVYTNDSLGAFRAYVNSSNARGATVYEAYTDQAFTSPIYISLTNVESFTG